MQSYDEQQRMIAAEKLDSDFIKRVGQIAAEIDKKNIANVVVGKLPNKGDEIKINGLVFLVKFVDYKHGALQLRIKRYEEDTEGEDGITHERGEIATG